MFRTALRLYFPLLTSKEESFVYPKGIMIFDTYIISWDLYILLFFRILASIVILGKACDLIDVHEQKKYSATSSPQKTTSAAAATAAASSSTTVETTSLTSQQQFVVARNSNSKESTNFATSNNHHHNNISSKEELFCRENSNIATPPDSMPVASSTPPLTSPDVTSDQINLLEAKLQAIVGSDALHISPPTPVIEYSCVLHSISRFVFDEKF